MELLQCPKELYWCHICEITFPPMFCDICNIHLCTSCVDEHLLDESKEHKVVPLRCPKNLYCCHICEIRFPPMHCDLCNIHLCASCVGEHLLDESKEHKVVPIKKRGSTTKCPKHCSRYCELYCEQCDIPICLLCISSGEHEQHKKVDILRNIENKKAVIRKDLKEFQKSIYPKYQEIASIIPVQVANLNRNSKELKTAIEKHGENLHKEINLMITQMISDLDRKNFRRLVDLNNQEYKITLLISEIEFCIANLERIINCDDMNLVSNYKSWNAKFRELPPKPIVSLPSFIPQKINKEQLYQQFGSLSALSIETEEPAHTNDTPVVKSSQKDKSLMDVPRIITEINTEYRVSNRLYSVSCLDLENVLTCCDDEMIRLYNLEGKLLNSFQTKSGNSPWDITVTDNRDIVYVDFYHRTVNRVTNTHVKTVVRLRGWKPLGVCSTSSGDLLVVMYSDDQTKVSRYSGSTKNQSIQYDRKGRPLYSSGPSMKYIIENRNQDICVSDYNAKAVVVVNQAGRLQFKYTGLPSTFIKKFRPRGITTDSQCRIMTVDCLNNCIHILDQYGEFLRYIANCNLMYPLGLCIDSNDNLFVAEYYIGKVKKIQYCM